MTLTNKQMKSAVLRTNKMLLYRALASLRKEKIERVWNGNYCKDQIRSAVKQKGCIGGWSFYLDGDGVMRPGDIAIQFAGSNGIRQERWVAMRILEALRSAGLYAEWQGNLRKKILVDMVLPVWEEKLVNLKAA